MTGDGVNDAPRCDRPTSASPWAVRGTEVAKEAADMVLTDDDFATIEGAVEEGRGVFDNLTKFIVWTLPTNMGEGLVILVAIVLGAALPILPVQILWINMTTAVALGLMLAFEPKEPGIMMPTAPRPHDARCSPARSSIRILLVSALLVGGTWWLFEWETRSGEASLAEARTAAPQPVRGGRGLLPVQLPLAHPAGEHPGHEKTGDAGDDQGTQRHRPAVLRFLAERFLPDFAEEGIPAPADEKARDRRCHHGEIVDLHVSTPSFFVP